ncbi:MAG: tRNA preQ1(34) S-adenosylmethionine ribosyltransferase-isomerase QueA [Acidobacteria bacterium]|nr:tRNA preQ1(34) S-adenosylmethionine ribosyltransferase-isomerase QueA [Acidobacteriota bacterium]
MRVSDFHFDLPPELIAQHPPAERDAARMLTVSRAIGAYEDKRFRDLPSLLREGDVLVLNNSRVIPARLFARRAGLHTQHNSPVPTGQIEVLLTQPLGENKWRALVKPGKKVPAGETLLFGDNDELTASVLEAGDFGERILQFSSTEDFFSIIERIGHMPLPPYMHREDTLEDRTRYQTVFSSEQQKGSAAAPTAGLHFTPQILEQIKARGVQVQYVTLHVGLGTFQPVRVDELKDIHLHEEPYTLPAGTAAAINRAKAENRRVIAAGTTTVRTLEHCAQQANGELQPHSGTTSIFISPGFQFRIVDALLTNFHLPQSTLLMLVSAFTGRESVLRAYNHAVNERYRFFSYGDCMFVS